MRFYFWQGGIIGFCVLKIAYRAFLIPHLRVVVGDFRYPTSAKSLRNFPKGCVQMEESKGICIIATLYSSFQYVSLNLSLFGGEYKSIYQISKLILYECRFVTPYCEGGKMKSVLIFNIHSTTGGRSYCKTRYPILV